LTTPHHSDIFCAKIRLGFCKSTIKKHQNGVCHRQIDGRYLCCLLMGMFNRVQKSVEVL